MRAIVLVLLAACDEGRAPAPPPAPVAIADAAPLKLLGAEPATLGPAFDGLALGQRIDQAAADQWLKQRGIRANAYVRADHLVSLAIRDPAVHWQVGDYRQWRSGHQHATEIVTEQATWLQFDLEVPLEQWLNTSPQSIVPTALAVEPPMQVPTQSNFVDGLADTTWTDSALAGAVTATHVTVAETHTGQSWHELEVDLDGSLALYDSIDRRLTELFGPQRSKKLELTHTPSSPGVEHIVLVWRR